MEGSVIKVRRRSLSLNYFNDAVDWRKNHKPEKAGVTVTGWSDGKARRLGSFIDNFYKDFTVMVTLTYGVNFPRDGKQCKAHLRAFTERIRREGYLEKNSWVWFLEFQRRGAPHYHLLCTGFLPKKLVSEAWAAVSGSPEASSTRCEQIRHPDAVGSYARKYAQKSAQKAVPIEFQNCGRMWGYARASEMAGLKLQPVEAYAVSRTPCAIMREVGKFQGVRSFETRTGWAFYGTEQGINQLWHYLRAVGSSVAHPVTKKRGLTPSQLAEWLVLRGLPACQVRIF